MQKGASQVEDPLEEEMATHSSVLTWEIPGTPGRLQSTGSPRVRHDQARTPAQRTGDASVFVLGPWGRCTSQMIRLQEDPPPESLCLGPLWQAGYVTSPPFWRRGVSRWVVSVTAGELRPGECQAMPLTPGILWLSVETPWLAKPLSGHLPGPPGPSRCP